MNWLDGAGVHVQLLAAETPTSGGTGSSMIDQLLPYLNFGLIVVLVIMFVTKTGIVPKWSLDEAEKKSATDASDTDAKHQREIDLLKEQIETLKADKAELKATNEELTKVAQEQFLPALIEANRLTALYVDTLARRGG